MSVTNPDKVVTKQDLADFYEEIFPYLGGMPEMVANRFSKSDIYSTSEKMIGQWTDGKPIYQKTIETTIPTTSEDGTVGESKISVGESVDNFIDIKGIMLNAGANAITPYIAKDDPFYYYQVFGRNNSYATSSDRNKLIIRNTKANLSGAAFCITIQYTKTTDSAVSIGVDTDYSTTEKIVGTWVDSKPIYQKTIVDTMPTISTDGTYVGKDIDPAISNLGTVISLTGFMPSTQNSSSIFVNGGQVVMNPQAFYNINAYIGSTGTIKMSANKVSNSGKTVYITLQYTKTTD